MAPVGQITNQQIVDIGMISLSNYSKLGTFSNKISNLEYILQYLYCMYSTLYNCTLYSVHEINQVKKVLSSSN